MLKLKLQYFGHFGEELTHWKRPWCWKDWRQEEKGTTEDERDGWMALPTWWIWVWVNSGSWGWTGKPGVLQSMGTQRVWDDWATEWTDWRSPMLQLGSICPNEYHFQKYCIWFPQFSFENYHSSYEPCSPSFICLFSWQPFKNSELMRKMFWFFFLKQNLIFSGRKFSYLTVSRSLLIYSN